MRDARMRAWIRDEKVVKTNTHTRGPHICEWREDKGEKRDVRRNIGGGAAQDFDLHSP